MLQALVLYAVFLERYSKAKPVPYYFFFKQSLQYLNLSTSSLD